MTDFGTLVERFATVAAAGDGLGLAALFTEDGVYEDYFLGPYQGRDAIAGMLAHFAEGGTGFRWSFRDPVASGRLGYASYRFSYASKAPEAAGVRVVFEGIGRFELADGLIRRYSEVFDRGMALAQQNYAPDRLAKICRRYAEALKRDPAWADHLRP
jgi:hypothetical protein